MGFSLRTDFRPTFRSNFEDNERRGPTAILYISGCPVIGSSRRHLFLANSGGTRGTFCSREFDLR